MRTYNACKKGGMNMKIGDKILCADNKVDIIDIATIENIVPAVYKDNGNETWYEICDATKAEYIIMLYGNEKRAIVIAKNEENFDMLADLI